jgi:hypothetical protein
MTFFEFVSSAHILPPIVSFTGSCIGFYYYKSLDAIRKSLTWYLFVMLLVDIASRLIIETGNNFIVLLAYSLIEITMFAWFYFKLQFNAKHRLIIGLFFVSFLYILWEIVSLERKEVKGFQSYAKVVDDFLIIILALTFFHERINIFRESKWDNFRLNTVILVFFSFNLSLFLPLNFILNDTFGYYFWFGNILSLLLFYSYLTHSIWKNGRTQKLLLSGLR